MTDQSVLLDLVDADFESVSLGMLQVYEFALIRRVGQCVMQHQSGGDIITLDADETVEGVFRFAKFVDAVQGYSGSETQWCAYDYGRP